MDRSKENLSPIVQGFLKGVGSIVPIGNIAVGIINELQSKQIVRKVKRMEDFLEQLQEDIDGIKDKINDSCINCDDFSDIFEKTSRYVVNERNEDKRRLFKNIFEHTITDKDYDFDETEQYFRLLEQLSPFQLDILAVLYNPSKYNNAKGKIIPDPINNQWQSSWGQYSGGGILTRLMQKRDYEVRSAVSSLYYNGLVNENLMDRTLQTNGNPIHVLDNSLTIYGRRFVKYLLDV